MKSEVLQDGSMKNLSVFNGPKNDVEKGDVDRYINNRVINRSKQFKYWRLNWRSGLIRLLERILIGVNISDRLGGDFTHFENNAELSAQVSETHLLNELTPLQKISIRPLGSTKSIQLSGIARERRVIRFSEVNVDSYTGLIRTDIGFVVDSIFPSSHKLIYMGGLSDGYASTNRKVDDLRGTWAVLPFSEYYFHTLIEEIASLLAIREFEKNFKVLVYKDAPYWTLDLLDTLGFDFRITRKRGIHVEDLLCTTSVGVFSNNDSQRFSKCILKNNNDKKTNSSKLFLSRGKLSRGDEDFERRLLREPTFANYIRIVPEELSIKEQVECFKNASTIVSFHGGVLSNIVWCKKGTKILEIFNHPYRIYDFARIAYEGGLEYCAIDTVNQSFDIKLLRKFLAK